MTAFRQYLVLVGLHMRMLRNIVVIIAIVNVGFAVGLILGFSYIIPNISDTTALFLVTGTATQMLVTVGLVGLPQSLSEMKRDGRVEYFMTLPISREAYLLSLATTAFLQALPAIVLALLFGAWYYEIPLTFDPLILLVVPLAVLALAGIGMALAIVSPHMQVTNGITQMIIFYALFFGPVILPKEQLPMFLQHVADFMPTTYAADAMRGAVTDLPAHLARSIGVMAAFAAGSLTLSALVVRRRA